MIDRYIQGKEKFVETCVQCGVCATRCPVLEHTELKGVAGEEIQARVHTFLATGEPDPMVYTRAFSCMECFKCVSDICPLDLNPMMMNQWIKGAYCRRGLAKDLYVDSGDEKSLQRIISSIQVTGEEYDRLTTPSPRAGQEVVFFPGCNAYFQPEKLLSALDIMDALTGDYAFLPGLDHCCGDNALFFGRLETGTAQAGDLVDAVAQYGAKTLVLWCPTCHCRFEESIKTRDDLPFEVVSFPQYLAGHMDELDLNDTAAGSVTLHDPCKSTYTGVDLDGTRQVLAQLPGVELREMTHYGKDAACCGSGAVCWYPEAADAMRDARLKEASETGAECMVTVCHYCNQVFGSRMGRVDFEVVNYVSLVARAMGIQRRDTFQDYIQWQDADRILADAAPCIEVSPFSREEIREAVVKIFL